MSCSLSSGFSGIHQCVLRKTTMRERKKWLDQSQKPRSNTRGFCCLFLCRLGDSQATEKFCITRLVITGTYSGNSSPFWQFSYLLHTFSHKHTETLLSETSDAPGRPQAWLLLPPHCSEPSHWQKTRFSGHYFKAMMKGKESRNKVGGRE